MTTNDQIAAMQAAMTAEGFSQRIQELASMAKSDLTPLGIAILERNGYRYSTVAGWMKAE